ncbi:MAG: hypothetical protein ACXVAX_03000 [Pseudobdellovibrio sp.]
MKRLVVVSLIILITARARASCADSFENLKQVVGQSKCPPLSWQENHASDGKPMQLVLTDSPLQLKITKGDKEWMHSKIEVCRDGDDLTIKFSEQPTIVNRDVLPLANSSLKKDAHLPVEINLTALSMSASFWTGHFHPVSPAQDQCK